MEFSITKATIIGINATSASIIAMSLNLKDWKAITAAASIGCLLGARYLEYGKPLFC